MTPLGVGTKITSTQGEPFIAKKTFAIIALAVFAVPTAASAVGYVPQDSITVSGESEAGATVTVTFGTGAFGHGAEVTFGVTGAGKPTTLSVFKAATSTLVKTADNTGSVAPCRPMHPVLTQ